ncbi:hypothetical protein TIFTF001_006202 [Ficus carica]|uniref:Uncharacterized protein n=1 Tax=Ficus carica TaxID=3494 RepID=A0AA87ZQL0_FICCA|nr:hypothetical protein TIFTF001_006202 [Ficus carica]
MWLVSPLRSPLFSFSFLNDWRTSTCDGEDVVTTRECQPFLFPILASSPTRDSLQQPIFGCDLGCWFLFCRLNRQEVRWSERILHCPDEDRKCKHDEGKLLTELGISFPVELRRTHESPLLRYDGDV